jgi:hypothetical protein
MALPGRTTSDLVEAIIDTDVDISLDPFIDAANYLVTTVCGVIPLGGYSYTPADLELIERWLAAHMYAVRESRPQRQRAGTLTEEVQSKVDLGLSVTHYGQQAMVLDVNGGLAALNAKSKATLTTLKPTVKAGVKWLGTRPCDIPPL